MALVTLTNLLAYGDFEGTGWTGAVSEWATDHVRYGSHSCKVTGDTTSPEKCIYHTGGASLTQGHVYYGRYELYHEGAQGSAGMYWPEAEPAFFEGHALGPANQWNIVSGRNVRSAWASGAGQTVRIDYNNGNTTGSVWIDGAVLVDLTAAFGAGQEPDLEWCDANIPFFIGQTQVDDTPTINGLVVSLVSIQPNPAEVSQTILASVAFTQITGTTRTLPANAWEGTGPYQMDISVPDVTASMQCFAFVHHSATVLQRTAEANACLICSVLSEGVVRVRALATRPREDIPLTIFNGGLGPIRTVSVPVSSWQGSGPWTATIGAGSALSTACVGIPDSADDDDASEISECGIHVSGVSGGNVTLRAMLAKPSMDLTVGIVGV